MTDETGAFGTTKAFTKEMLDSVMMSSRSTPDVILVSSYTQQVFSISLLAADERWNWRRTKRELRRIGLKRKGARRPYHKRALDG